MSFEGFLLSELFSPLLPIVRLLYFLCLILFVLLFFFFGWLYGKCFSFFLWMWNVGLFFLCAYFIVYCWREMGFFSIIFLVKCLQYLGESVLVFFLFSWGSVLVFFSFLCVEWLLLFFLLFCGFRLIDLI